MPPIETQPLDEPPPVVEEPIVEPPPIVEQPIETQPIETQPIETQPLDELPPVVDKPFVETKPVEPVETKPVDKKPADVKPIGRRSTTAQPVEDDYIDVGKTIRFNKMPTSEPTEPTVPVEPIKTEPIKVKPVEPEPIQSEPIKPVPVEAEIVDPERNNIETEVNEPFKDLAPTEPITFEPQIEQPTPAVENPYQRYEERPSTTNNRTSNVKPIEPSQSDTSTTAKKKGKKLKPRFVKLTSDDSFDYYLDKSSVQWQNLPYSASEYMADVWIRMLDKDSSLDDLPPDLQNYINDQSNDEIAEAEARGLIYDPVDVKVLRTKKYFLEHYYIRPQRRQIQFLCELEVVGRPQNTISERAYDYKNWENLIPGSIETAIYYGVLDVIGTGKAGSRGHMTVADMVEEYARISIR